MSFSAMGGDWTVCYDQARIEDAKGSVVGWLFPMQMTVVRYSFATEGARWWNKHPACRGPGCISQLVDSTYYYFEFYKTVEIGVGKELCPPLPLKSVAGENNKMNCMILSFSAIGGNCSVQSASHPTLLLWISACWGYINIYQSTFTTIMKQITNTFFRFLRQTQTVKQSSHTCCRPEFPLNMFAFRRCHGMATSLWELSSMAALTSLDPFVKRNNRETSWTRVSRNPHLTSFNDKVLNRLARLL